jgi:cytochrome c5
VRNYDLVFLKHFSQVIAVLVGITIALILLGIYFNSRVQQAPSQAAQQRTLERIRPVGAVFAGSTGAAQQRAAEAEANRRAASEGAAFGGSTDGAMIYQNLCGGCHTAGVGGAPTLAPGQLGARLAASGLDTLVTHAVDGYDGPGEGVMPARGGMRNLNDEQVRAAVTWMSENIR